MKQRIGFVSNSSSSSFCICSKEQLTKEKYNRALGIIPGTFVHSVIGISNDPTSDYKTIEELFDNLCMDDEVKFLSEFADSTNDYDKYIMNQYNYLKLGWSVYIGSFERSGEFGDVVWTSGKTGMEDVKLFSYGSD